MPRLTSRRLDAVTAVAGRTTSDHSGPATPAFTALLVHGSGDRDEHEAELARRLMDDGAAVCAIDLASAQPEPSGAVVATPALDAMVDDLAAALDRVSGDNGGRPLVLLGHALGAVVCVRVAQQRSEECAALVLWDPSLGEHAELSAVQRISNGASLGPLPVLWLHSHARDPLDPAIERVRGDALQEHRRARIDGSDTAQTTALVDLIILFVQRALRWETMLR